MPQVTQAVTVYTSPFSVANLDGANGVQFDTLGQDRLGWSVSPAHDMDQDGIDDFTICATAASPEGRSYAGQCFLFYGHGGQWTSPITPYSFADGVQAVAINGIVNQGSYYNGIGYSLTSVKINGTSIILLGAPGASPLSRQAAGSGYAIFSQAGRLSNPFEVSGLNGNTGVAFYGIYAGNYFGINVAIGDLNCDGIPDYVFSSSQNSIIVVWGISGTYPSYIDLSTINGSNGIVINGLTGGSIGYGVGNNNIAFGDVNGDKCDDLLTSDPDATVNSMSNAGIIFLLFGKKTGWTSPISASSLIQITGVAAQDQAGYSLTSDDMDNDGYADIITGAINANGVGSVSVFRGHQSGWSSPVSLSFAAYRFDGITTGEKCGSSVSTGNMRKGAYKDIYITSQNTNSYVLFWKSGGYSNPYSLFNLNSGINGFIITSNFYSNPSFTTAGDPNKSGYNALLIGSPFEGVGNNYGEAFLIFGDGDIIWLANSFNISEGGSLVFSQQNINISTSNPQATTYQFLNQQHIQIQYQANLGIPITSASGADIVNLAVIGIHDGSPYPPSFTLVATRTLATSTVTPTIYFTPTYPVLGNNSIPLIQGQNIKINSAMLSATRGGVALDSLIFNFTSNQNGQWLPNNTYTQAIIRTGMASFKTNGGILPPSCKFTVSDGYNVIGPFTCNFNFRLIPQILKNSLTIRKNIPHILTPNDLSVEEADVDSGNIDSGSFNFTISNVVDGNFTQTNHSSIAKYTFPGQNIIDGDVQVISPQCPFSYDVSVTSPNGLTTGPQAANVTCYGPPSFTAYQLNINKAGSVTLTTANIDVVDTGVPAKNVVFTVNTAEYCHCEDNTHSGITITTFNKQQVLDGKITCYQDGSGNTPILDISVNDGFLSASTAVSVTFNTPATINSNAITITQGGTVILSSSNAQFSASDNATPAPNLMMCFGGTHGYYAANSAPGVPITSPCFLQGTLGQYRFNHDGSTDAPTMSLSVTNNAGIITGPASTDVSFTLTNGNGSGAASSGGSNLITTAVVPAVVSGVIGLLFLGAKIYLTKKAKQSMEDVSGVNKLQQEHNKNIIQPVAKRLFDNIKISGFLGYISDGNMKLYKSAVETLVGKLNDQGVDINLDKMSAINQSKLLNEITKQTKKLLAPESGCCSCSTLTHFFKAQVTPVQLDEKAEAIALAVVNSKGVKLVIQGNQPTNNYPTDGKEGEVELGRPSVSNSHVKFYQQPGKIQASSTGFNSPLQSPSAPSEYDEPGAADSSLPLSPSQQTQQVYVQNPNDNSNKYRSPSSASPV